MKTHTIITNRRARVITLGDETSKKCLIALHGYSDSVEKFSQSLESLSRQGFYIIIPEGLSRFYRKGFSGEVGASWMTKEFRDEEILDQMDYLDKVYETLIPAEANKTLLGFSQGTATASRWLAGRNREFDKLLLWAGQLSDDVDYHSKPFDDIHAYYVYGSRDEFMEHLNIDEVNAIENFSIVKFEGGHRLDDDTLINILG